MARLTTQVLLILAMTSFCPLTHGDQSQTDANLVADWTLDPDERLARLRRLTPSRLTKVDQAAGFSSRWVYEFDQDDQGFIWAGTRNGLDRFDGYAVRNYRHDPSSNDSLSSNDIRNLATAANGIVWAGSHAAGLDRFDSATASAINFRNKPGDPHDIGDDHITEVIVSRTGDIWAGTLRAGLVRIDHQTLEVTRFHTGGDNARRIPGDEVKFVFEDIEGRLWVGTDAGLIVTSESNSYFELASNDIAGIDTPIIVQSMQQAADRSLYLITSDSRLLRIRENKGNVGSVEVIRKNLGCSVTDPNSVMMDSHERLWIAAQSVCVYDTITDSFTQTQLIGSAPFEDRSGIIWLSTVPDVSRLDPATLVFGNIYDEVLSSDEIDDVFTFAVHEAKDGSVWIADSSGVWQRQPDSNEITHFVDSKLGAGGNDTNVLYQDAEEIIWAGTYDGGVNRIDPVSGHIKNYPSCDRDLANELCRRVWAIEGNDDGQLWIGTADNFLFLDGQSDSLQPVSVNNIRAKGMISSGVRALAQGRDDSLWIGTETGLLQWRRATNEWIRFVHVPNSAKGLSNNYINAMHVDDEGIAWIGTQIGLNRLDPATGQVQRFDTTTGLPNDDIHSVVEDVYGTIWVSTGKGLAALNKETHEIRIFDASSGLTKDEFLLGSGYAGKSGNVYFGGFETVTYFDPAMLKINVVPPQVVFTELRINNEIVRPDGPDSRAILKAPINATRAITLPYQRASLAVEFAGIHFARPEQNSYAYKLEGYDDDWIYTDSSRRIASYTSLPFGSYTLRVRASNSDGVWNDVGASLSITILTPFWRTWWASLLYILAAIALVLLIIQLRTKALTARAAILEDTVAERTRKIHENERLIQSQADDLTKLLALKEKLFTNVSHEFRTPLTLILGPVNQLLGSDITDKQASRLRLVKQNGQRLLRLVDQLLDLSRLDSEEPLTLSLQPISHATSVIAESFQPLASSRAVTFETDISDDLWVSASADALERILMNLLSNAFKYTPRGGDISISLHAQSEHVLLEISDSGLGIPLSRQKVIFERFNRADDTGENVPGAGIGLALVKEIVLALDGAIDLTSAPGEGTTVRITLGRCLNPEPQSQTQKDIVLSESSNAELESLTESTYVAAQFANDQEPAKPSILIIEDHYDMQQYLVELLSPSYACLVAGDGEAGLHMGLEEIPDLVLCDVMMPKMDGFKVSQKLKSDDRSSHIPIIMLTARGDHDSRLQGLKEKVDDYVAKPFDDEELLLRIENILSARAVLKKRILKQIFENGESETGFSKRDRKIIDKLNQIIEKHLLDSKYDVGAMSSDMAMSERAFQRKLKALTGQTPTQYVRKYRLRKSLVHLRDGMSVSQAAESVGFSSPAYFTSRFREEFGDTPRSFIK